MGDIYILSALIATAVGFILYLLFVPRKDYSHADLDNDNTFIKAANLFGDELFSALPAGVLDSEAAHPKIDSLLRKSGNPWKITPNEFIFITVLSTFIGFLFSIFFWFAINLATQAGFPLILFLVVGGVIASCTPYLKLKEIATNRENSYRRELPEALDLITISLAGGRTFQSALRDAIPNMNDSILKDEFTSLLASLDASKPLNECLQEFKERAPNESVRVFIQAVQEAVSLDVPLVHVLRSRAEDSRQELFSFIQDKVAALPTKLMSVLTPTTTIALLLLVAAPAGMALMNAL